MVPSLHAKGPPGYKPTVTVTQGPPHLAREKNSDHQRGQGMTKLVG